MKKNLMSLTALVVVTASLLVPSLSFAADSDMVEKGKKIAFSRTGGNCLACHAIEGGDQGGTMGPPLIAMKTRYPDKAVLRAQIWDSTKSNPTSQMPPFGKNLILTEEEIDLVVEFISTL